MNKRSPWYNPMIKKHQLKQSYVTEKERRGTPLGAVLYITIQRYDEQPMTWEEVHSVFADRYPGKWAIQTFPPMDKLVNEINMYHLFVLDDEPPYNLTINGGRSRVNQE